MFIGNVEIKGHAALAPMAGVADRAFRRMCMDYGAAFVVGEMVSGKGLTYGDRKSAELLELDEDIRPAAVQLFGDDPDILAKAAVMSLEYSLTGSISIWAVLRLRSSVTTAAVR